MKYQALDWSVHSNPNRPQEPWIGLIKLNRPETMNAIDVRMRVELDMLCDEIRWNSHLKTVIITGEGRGFSAGGDVTTEAGPLGATEDYDMGIHGPYQELAHYFFNDLRHQVLQRQAHIRAVLRMIVVVIQPRPVAQHRVRQQLVA